MRTTNGQTDTKRERWYMARDQYGQTYHGLKGAPRKALLDLFERKSARRMFIDTSAGAKHVGWIIAGLWLNVYEVVPMRRPA